MIRVTLDPNLLQKETAPEVRRIVRKVTFDLELEIKKSLLGPRTGTVYRRRRRVHRASAPGEAPATDTGNLVKSISSRFPSDFEGEITIGARYAEALEMGSRRIEPRPFVGPSIESVTRLFR